jgi:dihydroorotase-like cyclic amidohydrolase
MASLIFKGRVFAGGKVSETAVRVENGVIAKVATGDLGAADRTITLDSKQILIPGGVDALCALRDWGEELRDTTETCTKAAAAAGVTTIGDQPNTAPRVMSAAKIRERAALVAANSYVDFGIGASPPEDLSELEEYAAAGAYGMVLFPWDLRPWSYPVDLDDSRALFKRYAAQGLSALIMVDELAHRETPLWEDGEGVALTALLRRMDPDLKARLQIARPDSVERINQAKDKLPNLAVTAAVHSVLISKDEAYQRIGSAAGHSPPLRPQEEVDRMAEAVKSGAIDIVISHHAPHRTPDKYRSEPIPGEFTPKLGYSAIDSTYPLLLTKLGIEAACRAHAEAPAKHLGLKKGKIAQGYDADFALIEDVSGVVEKNFHVSGGPTAGVFKVDPTYFYSKGKVTPFVGERLKYRVMKTFLHGEEIYDAGAGAFTRGAVRQFR